MGKILRNRGDHGTVESPQVGKVGLTILPLHFEVPSWLIIDCDMSNCSQKKSLSFTIILYFP